MYISHLKFYYTCSFTIFGFVFLQTLVEVWPELWAEDRDDFFPVHLAESRAVHGAVGQTQGVCVELGAFYVVADPLQNVVCCPAVGVDMPVPLTC